MPDEKKRLNEAKFASSCFCAIHHTPRMGHRASSGSIRVVWQNYSGTPPGDESKKGRNLPLFGWCRDALQDAALHGPGGKYAQGLHMAEAGSCVH